MRFIYTKTFAIFFLCLCLLVLLLFLNSRGSLDPFKRFLLRLPGPLVKFSRGTGNATKGFFTTLYSLKTLARENTELKNKITDLQNQLAMAQTDVRDNAILRKELDFVKNTKLTLIPCDVLSSDALGLTDELILDCGKEQGVVEGQVILAQGHVVGKIVYVGQTTSNAILASSSKFLIDARVSQTGQAGVVEGSFNSGLQLDQLPQSAELKTGWLVVTAGINSVVPKDMLIGEVGQIISTENDLFKRASLITPVDLTNLQFVQVVK